MKYNIRFFKNSTVVCYDKEHNKHSMGNENVHMLLDTNNKKFNVLNNNHKVASIIDVICNVLGLEGYERSVYSSIIINKEGNYKTIVSNLSRKYTVNAITIKRAIKSLLYKDILFISHENELYVNPIYNIEVDGLESKKYIIIDIS